MPPVRLTVSLAPVTATLSPPAKHGRVIQRLRGAGSVQFCDATWQDMPTQHHVINALASLPIHAIRAASLMDSEGGASGRLEKIILPPLRART